MSYIVQKLMYEKQTEKNGSKEVFRLTANLKFLIDMNVSVNTVAVFCCRAVQIQFQIANTGGN